jgi:methionyl aminopeptidase
LEENMIITSDKELVALKHIGQIVARVRDEMIEHIVPGITTGELDRIGETLLRTLGARSAPQVMYRFPGATCISMNDEAAHGIPGQKPISEGDLVNVDVSAEYGGYYADTGATVLVNPGSEMKEHLVRCSRSALEKAILTARNGGQLSMIGKAIEKEARKHGFTVIKNLCGHGIGRSLHEPPHEILNYYNPFIKESLVEGMVLAIETFVSSGAEYVFQQPDGWTLKTPNGCLVAQFEHTVVITNGKPIVLTEVAT